MSTPSSLRLEPTPPDVKRYQRLKLLANLGSLGLTLILLLLGALWAGPRVDQGVRKLVGDCPWLRLITLGLVYALVLEGLTLPLSFWSSYVVEHRYGLSTQTLRRWMGRQGKGYLLGGVMGLALLLGFYYLLRGAGAWWWLIATGAWLLVTLVLGQLLPVVILPLFSRVTRLENSELTERLRRLSEGTGLSIEGVYRWELSADTRKVNAALAGLGSTRRILLGDTLLEEFTPEEIEVVFAHEVGHHVRGHLLKGIALSVVLSAVGFFLVDRVLHALTHPLGYSSFDDPAALPLVLLVLTLFGLAFMPLQNAVSRHFERQCDREALARTGDRDAYRSAFVKLARKNKADADPHPVMVWLFEDHPPIRERLALAEHPPLP